MRYLLGRRVAAGLCAVALMAALVVFPVRAKAAAALPVIGYAATITAFLAACGIYPFQNENGESFGEWGARKLTDLWDTYVTEVYPESEAAQVISDVKSFYANGGYMVMARDTWDKLRAFAGWITGKYSLADNQTGITVGAYSHGLLVAPVFDSLSDYNANKAANGLALYVTANVSSPHYVGVRSWAGSASDICVDSNGPVVMLFKQGSNTCVGFFGYRQFCVFGGFNGPGAPWSDCWAAWSDTSVGYQVFADLGGPGYGYYNYWSIRVPYSGVFRDFPVYASAKAAIAAYAQALGNPTLKGVMADTSVVDLLGELPEGAEMGGLAVAGAGAGVDALEDVIESGVMERQKPAVRPVEVEIGEGAEVDADAGTVTEETPSVITITPESVPLSVSDYAVPGLHTLFPFSVPWDIARVWQALDAEPRWFLEDVVLTFPAPELWGGEPLVVTFRMEDMPQQLRDAVQGLAATVRAFLLIIACIGFLVFAVGFIKF